MSRSTHPPASPLPLSWVPLIGHLLFMSHFFFFFSVLLSVLTNKIMTDLVESIVCSFFVGHHSGAHGFTNPAMSRRQHFIILFLTLREKVVTQMSHLELSYQESPILSTLTRKISTVFASNITSFPACYSKL